ncbi:MAG: sugar transferase [Candidatus Omnitrophota bacterium]
MTRSSPLAKLIHPTTGLFILTVIVIDLILVVFSDLAAFTLRFGTDIVNPPPANFFAYLRISALIIILRLACFYIFGFYHNIRSKSNYEIITNTFRATVSSSVIIIVIAFYTRALAYPRTVILISWALTTSSVILWHIFVQSIIEIAWKGSRINFLVIGTDREAHRIGLHLSKDASTTNCLVGYVRLPTEEKHGDTCDTDLVLGTIDSLGAIIADHSVDEVMVAAEKISSDELSVVARAVSGKNVTLKLLPGIYEAAIGNIINSPVVAGNIISSIMVSPVHAASDCYHGLKRILDLVFSFLILFFFWPIMILAAVLIKLTSKGPVLFEQERVGLNGHRFMMCKFRTMYENAEEDSGPVWAALNDPRITPFGKFLRLSRLDELPQVVFNVIRNEMSLVGPRPERPYFVEELMREIPFYAERLSVKPGITGWAQVNYKYAGTVEESREKFLLDIFYLKNMSFALDFWIFLKTLWTIIQEKGAQ